MHHRVATEHASKEDCKWNAATSRSVGSDLYRSDSAHLRKATSCFYRIIAANAEGFGSMTVTRSGLW